MQPLPLIKNPTQFPEAEAHFWIDGPAGNLELLTVAVGSPRGVGIICHPHPLHQGTMHNKVVHTVSRAFHQQGLHTVRFNFRGVGKSEGQFGDSEGEVADLDAIFAWIDKVLPHSKRWLAGFSFGAYIAARGAITHHCEQLYSIAPAVTNQPYETLAHIHCPWVVMQGEQDEVISAEKVYAWYESNQSKHTQISFIRFPETSHFFHGKLIALREQIEATLVID